MREIKRIDYFTKNKDKVMEKLGYGNLVKRISDNTNVKIVKTDNEWYIGFIDKETNTIIHRFTVGKKTFDDLSCNRNCPYKYALALKLNWFIMKQETTPISQWIFLEEDRIRKYRFEIKGDNVIVRFKDKYNNMVWDRTFLDRFYPWLGREIGKVNQLRNLNGMGLLQLKKAIKFYKIGIRRRKFKINSRRLG